MPDKCAVDGCLSNYRSKSGIIFHKFPKDEELKNRWISLCNPQKEINPDFARVCCRHFELSDYKRHLKYELLNLPIPKQLKMLTADAVPKLHLPASRVDGKNSLTKSTSDDQPLSCDYQEPRNITEMEQISIKEEVIEASDDSSEANMMGKVCIKDENLTQMEELCQTALEDEQPQEQQPIAEIFIKEEADDEIQVEGLCQAMLEEEQEVIVPPQGHSLGGFASTITVEEHKLVVLINKWKDVMNQSGQDREVVTRKNEAWQHITRTFNNASVTGPKTELDLRKMWKNIRIKMKMASVEERLKQNAIAKLKRDDDKYRRIEVYLRTGHHSLYLSPSIQRDIQRYAPSYMWDKNLEALFYTGISPGISKQLVRSPEQLVTVLRNGHLAADSRHQDAEATLDAISKVYFWTGMKNDVTSYVNACYTCQRAKLRKVKTTGRADTRRESQEFTFDDPLWKDVPDVETGPHPESEALQKIHKVAVDRNISKNTTLGAASDDDTGMGAVSGDNLVHERHSGSISVTSSNESVNAAKMNDDATVKIQGKNVSASRFGDNADTVSFPECISALRESVPPPLSRRSESPAFEPPFQPLESTSTNMNPAKRLCIRHEPDSSERKTNEQKEHEMLMRIREVQLQTAEIERVAATEKLKLLREGAAKIDEVCGTVSECAMNISEMCMRVMHAAEAVQEEAAYMLSNRNKT